MNPTMAEIYELANKKNTKFGDILKCYKIKYPSENPERIYRDVVNSIKWLFMNNFIYFKNEKIKYDFIEIITEISKEGE